MKAYETERYIINLIRQTKGTRGSYPTTFEKVKFLLWDNVNPTMTHEADTLYYTHGKRIHSVGFVASVSFTSIGNHSYTGLFTGAPYGLIRLSLATAPSLEGMTPGVAVKLFRDHKPSANFVAMYKLQGQTSGNFFEHDFSNHVPMPPTNDFALQQLVKKFTAASTPPNQVGLSDIAKMNVNGNEVNDIQYPYEIILKPGRGLREMGSGMQHRPTADLKITFDRIPVGSVLYDVYARSNPLATPVFIGTLKTKSNLMDSSYGDQELFFRHQKMAEDLNGRPEWKSSHCDDGAKKGSKCPFGYE